MRKNTVYGGVYDEDHPTISMFWQVVAELSEDEKRKLVKFITSCYRPPLLGFQELLPLFAIRDATNDQERLPTASTCVNLLKLPVYTDIRTLRS
jgi:ubiquitin-protein ligase E3 C